MLDLRKVVLLMALATASTLSSASIIGFGAPLSGANEVPPNASTATGSATVWIDDVLDTLQLDVSWSGLTGGVPVAAHIHCCSLPGVNSSVAIGFPGFPPTTAGTYSHLFDLTNAAIYSAGFFNGVGGGTPATAEAALIAGLEAGKSYVNIHNQSFPGGEIRGNLVPEPATLALVGAGIAMLGWSRRRR